MKLLCFGFGYTARAVAARLGDGWEIVGTSREGNNGCRRFDREHRLADEAFASISHVLVSIPPEAGGDPVLDAHREDIARIAGLQWLGYLSTTGVYGTRNGGWVDENSELRPTGLRGAARVAAEAAWLGLWRERDVPVHIFRLAGIYGPCRNAFDALRAGTARRIDAGAQVFSRVHVDDIAAVLLASMTKPEPGAIYNVCDDEPAAQEAVIAYAAGLLGIEPPPLVPLADTALSPMARSFYADNKRVSNGRMTRELGVALVYPSYREGLAAILAAGG